MPIPKKIVELTTDPWAKKTLPRVQALLEKRDLSNGDVARGTTLSRTHVGRVLSGSRKPSLRTARLIAGFLGMNVETLCRLLDVDTEAVK